MKGYREIHYKIWNKSWHTYTFESVFDQETILRSSTLREPFVKEMVLGVYKCNFDNKNLYLYVCLKVD